MAKKRTKKSSNYDNIKAGVEQLVAQETCYSQDSGSNPDTCIDYNNDKYYLNVSEFFNFQSLSNHIFIASSTASFRFSIKEKVYPKIDLKIEKTAFYNEKDFLDVIIFVALEGDY